MIVFNSDACDLDESHHRNYVHEGDFDDDDVHEDNYYFDFDVDVDDDIDDDEDDNGDDYPAGFLQRRSEH